MTDNKILIPVDFSYAADKAIEFGVMLAKQLRGSITLLHVFEDDILPFETCNSDLERFARQINEDTGIQADFICEKGDIFSLIPFYAAKQQFRMVVIATHGRKGLRQKFFGADIIKLLKKIPKPTLVVQEHSQVPSMGFTKAVFAVGGHDSYDKKIDAMILVAGLFNMEIHLYSISKPGYEQTDKLRENIKLAEHRFSQKGLEFKRVVEDQQVFSVGFSKQTLKYASASGADLIAIMVNPTRENYYFADSDKEAILTNEKGIAVLSVSNANASI